MAVRSTKRDMFGGDSLIEDHMLSDGLLGSTDHSVNFSPEDGTKSMYQGKNVHFSVVDGKPLCSYSGKLCKQRRLNGYAFCIRHVLEDPGARFKQCEYVARYNNQRCTNPIPDNEDRIYCNSHMQVLGLVPKTVRKKKTPIPEVPSPSPDMNSLSAAVPFMPPRPVANKRRAPRKGAKAQAKTAQAKGGPTEGKRKVTRPRTKSPLIAKHEIRDKHPQEILRPQEATSHAGASNDLVSHESSQKTRVSVAKMNVPPIVTTPTVHRTQMAVEDLTRLKPVIELCSTLRFIKWQEKCLTNLDVYPVDNEHAECLVSMEIDSTAVDIKRDDDVSACQFYDSLVAQRKAECQDGLSHLEVRLRLSKDADARSCGVVRKTLKAVREAPLASVGVCLMSSSKELKRLRRKHVRSDGPLCCMAVVGKYRCGRKPLPYARYCLQHICGNTFQFLFRSCAGFISNEAGIRQSCPFPVTDIIQYLPYCNNHSSLTTQSPENATLTPPSRPTEPPAKQPRRKAPGGAAQTKRGAAKPRVTKPCGAAGSGGSPANRAVKRTAKRGEGMSGTKPKVGKMMVRAKQAHIPVFTENVDEHKEKDDTMKAVNGKPPPLLAIPGIETSETHIQPPPLVRVSLGGDHSVVQGGSQILTMSGVMSSGRSQVSSKPGFNSMPARQSSSDSTSGSDVGSSDDSSDDGSSDDGLVMATNEGMPQYEHERLQNLQMEQQVGSVSSHQHALPRQSGGNSPFMGMVTTPTHASPSPNSQFQRNFPRLYSSDSYDLSPHHRRHSSQHEFSDRPFSSPHDVSSSVRSLYPTHLPFDDIQAPPVDQSAFEFDLMDTNLYKQSPVAGSPLFPHHMNFSQQHHTNPRGTMREMTTPTGHDSLASSFPHGSGLFDVPSPTH